MDTLIVSHGIFQKYFSLSNNLGIYISAIAAVIIFIAGALLEGLRQWKKDKKRLLDIRDYFYSQLDVLIDISNRQRILIEEFIESLKKEIIQDWELSINAQLHIDHLKDIGPDVLFNILVIKEKGEKEIRINLFNDLMKQLDLLKNYRLYIKENFDDGITKSNKYLDSWNQNIKTIRGLHDKWKIDMIQNSLQDEFLNQFMNLYSDWVNQENRSDMYIIEKNLNAAIARTS